MTTTFHALGVADDLAQSLIDRGIERPTEIQELAVPRGMQGRDLCAKAPTGSGKTIAFGLILAKRLESSRPGRIAALILVPTRELAQQVSDELNLLDQRRRWGTTAIYGGAGYAPQLQRLRRSSVVVATPGRLEDLMERRSIDLRNVEVVVLDEADRMADMGFLPSVRRIMKVLPSRRQVLLFSATLDGAVADIVSESMHDPVTVEARSAAVQPDIDHQFEIVPRAERPERVAALVQEYGTAIAFCRTKHGSDRFAKQIAALGVRSSVIHGNRSQAQRQTALNDFKSGRVDVLVATDVAARGIHIDDVPCVIHCDPPDDPKDYVHRSGRTGRAGSRGVVVSLVDPSQRRSVVRDMRSLGIDVQWSDAPGTPVPTRARPGSLGWLRDERGRRRVHRDEPRGEGKLRGSDESSVDDELSVDDVVRTNGHS